MYKYLHNSALTKIAFIFMISYHKNASFTNATAESGTVFDFHIFCQHAPNYNFTFL